MQSPQEEVHDSDDNLVMNEEESKIEKEHSESLDVICIKSSETEVKQDLAMPQIFPTVPIHNKSAIASEMEDASALSPVCSSVSSSAVDDDSPLKRSKPQQPGRCLLDGDEWSYSPTSRLIGPSSFGTENHDDEEVMNVESVEESVPRHDQHSSSHLVSGGVRRLLLEPLCTAPNMESVNDKNRFIPFRSIYAEDGSNNAMEDIEDQVSTILTRTVLFESSSSSTTSTDETDEDGGGGDKWNRGRSGSALSSSVKPRLSGLGWRSRRCRWRGIVSAGRSSTPTQGSTMEKREGYHIVGEDEDEEDDDMEDVDAYTRTRNGGEEERSKDSTIITPTADVLSDALDSGEEEDEGLMENPQTPKKGSQEDVAPSKVTASSLPEPKERMENMKKNVCMSLGQQHEASGSLLPSSAYPSSGPSSPTSSLPFSMPCPSFRFLCHSFRCGQPSEHHERYVRFVQYYFGLSEDVARREAKYMRTTYASAVRLVSSRRDTRKKRRDSAGGSSVPHVVAVQDLPRHSSVAVEGDYLFTRLMKRAEFLTVTREYMAAAAAIRVSEDGDGINVPENLHKNNQNHNKSNKDEFVKTDGNHITARGEMEPEKKRRWWWSTLYQTDVRLSNIIAFADSIERKAAAAAIASTSHMMTTATTAQRIDGATLSNSSPQMESCHPHGKGNNCGCRKPSIRTGVSHLKPNARCIVLHYGFPHEEKETNGLHSGQCEEDICSSFQVAKEERAKYPAVSLMAVVTTRSVQQGEEIVVSLPSYYRCMDECGWYAARYEGLNGQDKGGITRYEKEVLDSRSEEQSWMHEVQSKAPKSVSREQNSPAAFQTFGASCSPGPSFFTRGIKRFSMWPSDLRFYHGIGQRHASHIPQASFPFTLLDLKEAKEIGPGELGVYASGFIPYGTCFLYGGSVATTEDVAEFMVHRREQSENVRSTSPTGLPGVANAMTSLSSSFSRGGCATQGGQKAGLEGRGSNTTQEPHRRVVEKCMNQGLDPDAPDVIREDLSNDTYALGLDDNTMCYGQGIARYINHRYNLSAFGNVELCSLSIPMISYRYESERTLPTTTLQDPQCNIDYPTSNSDARATGGFRFSVHSRRQRTQGRAWGGSTFTNRKGSFGSPTPPSTVSATSSPTSNTSNVPPSKGKRRKRVNGIDRITPNATLGAGINTVSLKPSMISIPFFMTTTDVVAGTALLAWTYGEEYDAQLERVAVADGYLVPYMDAEVLNRRSCCCANASPKNASAHTRGMLRGTEQYTDSISNSVEAKNRYITGVITAESTTSDNSAIQMLDGSSKTSETSNVCAQGTADMSVSLSSSPYTYHEKRNSCVKSAGVNTSERFFQRYKGDYRYGLRVGDVVWRRENNNLSQWQHDPHEGRTLETGANSTVRIDQQAEQELFVVVDTQCEGAEYVLLRRLVRRKVSMKDLAALLFEAEVWDDNQQEGEKMTGLKRAREMEDRDDTDNGPWAKVKKDDEGGIINSRNREGRQKKEGDQHRESPRIARGPGRPRKSSIQDRFAVLELPAEMHRGSTDQKQIIETDAAYYGTWYLAVSSTVSVALLQPDLDYVDISDTSIVLQWRQNTRFASSCPQLDSTISQRCVLVPLLALRRRTALARASRIIVPPLIHGKLWMLMKGESGVCKMDRKNDNEQRRKPKSLLEKTETA